MGRDSLGQEVHWPSLQTARTEFCAAATRQRYRAAHVCRDVHYVDKHPLLIPQLCREVSALLLEQLLFAQLLTSDLDGGVTMATRTQSIHFLNGILAIVGIHHGTVMYIYRARLRCTG